MRTRVGRAIDNEIVIEAPWISSLHALIEWRAPDIWELRDLGSRNGTMVNGVAMPAGGRSQLAVGDRIAFGDDASEWVVVDLERPVAEAVCVETGEHRHAHAQILTLSADPHDWVDLIEERPGVWVIERPGSCEAVADSQEIGAGGQRWRLLLPETSPPTEPLPAFGDDPVGAHAVALEFRVSTDLEFIEMFVRYGEQQWATSRAYTRGMLEMARARLADQLDGVVHPEERGWIYSDELCTLAGYESESRLNVEVHRARRELLRFGIPDATRLIQRRRGTGQLRVATEALRIVVLTDTRDGPTGA